MRVGLCKQTLIAMFLLCGMFGEHSFAYEQPRTLEGKAVQIFNREYSPENKSWNQEPISTGKPDITYIFSKLNTDHPTIKFIAPPRKNLLGKISQAVVTEDTGVIVSRDGGNLTLYWKMGNSNLSNGMCIAMIDLDNKSAVVTYRDDFGAEFSLLECK